MAFWISAAVLVGSAAIDKYNSDATARKQDNALQAKLRGDQFSRALANQKVRSLVQATQQSSPVQIKNQDLNQYLDTIRKGYAATQQPLNVAGGGSSAYDAAAQRAAQGISEYAGTRANTMASMEAPYQQRQSEAAMRSNTALDLNQLAHQMQVHDFLANLKIQGIQRNPYLDILSKGLKAYAGARAAGAGSGGGVGSDGSGALYNSGGYVINLPFK